MSKKYYSDEYIEYLKSFDYRETIMSDIFKKEHNEKQHQAPDVSPETGENQDD